MEKQKTYTLLITTENNIGLLNRVTVAFTRRKLNILSITASESKIKDVYSYTVVVRTDENKIIKVAKAIEKIIGVYKVFVYEDKDIVYQEIALYKIANFTKSNGFNLEQIVRKYHARILNIEEDYILIEKTGHKDETEELLRVVEKHGLLQFIRSGRIAIAKPMKSLEDHLQELEEAHFYTFLSENINKC